MEVERSPLSFLGSNKSGVVTNSTPFHLICGVDLATYKCPQLPVNIQPT